MGKTATLSQTVSAGGPLVDGGSCARGTAITTSGAATYDVTSIPAWVKKVTLMVRNVSASGLSTGAMQVQMGTSGGLVTTGYVFTGMSIDGTTITNNGGGGTAFQLIWTNADADQYTGVMELFNINGNLWVQRMQIRANSTRTLFSTGEIDLGGKLTTIRTFMGVGTFDGGTLNVLYE